MSDLDLDDVAATSPLAAAELAALRAEVEALKGAVDAYEADAVAYRAEVERLRSQFANSEREAERLRAALQSLDDGWKYPAEVLHIARTALSPLTAQGET